jgi:hypothetical protein
MSLMTCSAGAFPVPDFCLIFAPLKGYDEPEILRYQLSRFGPISADAGQVFLLLLAVSAAALWLLFDRDMRELQARLDGRSQIVRGQGFWDNWRGELTEALAHQGWHFRRLLLDEASGAV